MYLLLTRLVTGLSHSGSLVKPVYVFLISLVRFYMSCQFHLPWFIRPNNI
jgi:hypothetical protein